MHEKRILECERAEIGRRRPMRATRRYIKLSALRIYRISLHSLHSIQY